MNKKSLKSLWWVIKTQFATAKAAFLWRIGYSVYNGLSSIIAMFASAKLLSSVSEVALNHGDPKTVYFWLVVTVSIEVLFRILSSVDGLISKLAEQKLELVMNQRFFAKMYELSQEQFDDQDFRTMMDRAQDGLMRLWQVMDQIAWSLASLATFIAAIMAIIVVAPLVGLLIVLSTVPSVYLRIKQNNLRDATRKKTEPFDRVGYRTRWLLIDAESMPEVRLLNGMTQLVNIWKKNTKKGQDITYAAEKRGVLYSGISDVIRPAVEFIANLAFFRLLVTGALGLDRFIFVRGLMESANASALALASSFDNLHDLSIDLRNFDEFITTAPAIPNGKMVVTAPLTIEFKDVDFAYPGNKNLALEGISFQIHPGSKLALVGENGAGKSTLIKLLLRQYLPTKGQILVNGHDIKDVEQSSYYQALSILSQNFIMFAHLTIEENLAMGAAHDIKPDEMRKATDMVDATGFIDKLPHKFGQRLDSSFKDGSSLSGGQSQRLGVARAILREGDVMILDEPTSAIDAKAEYNIFNNIYAAHAGRTTLIVSHRFSTVRKAEKVIVMDKGKITEYGTHEELMAYGGLYKEMFDLQAEGYR